MKFTGIKRIRNICFGLIILVIFSQFVTGCGQNNQDNTSSGLESGFIFNNSSDSEPSPPPDYCAYKCDTNEFDINDVTLDFYYGGQYASGIEMELTCGRSYPIFEIYFADEDGNQYFIKHVEENLVSEKYRCDVIYDENGYIAEIKFNHSEKITIPAEILQKKVEKFGLKFIAKM